MSLKGRDRGSNRGQRNSLVARCGYGGGGVGPWCWGYLWVLGFGFRFFFLLLGFWVLECRVLSAYRIYKCKKQKKRRVKHCTLPLCCSFSLLLLLLLLGCPLAQRSSPSLFSFSPPSLSYSVGVGVGLLSSYFAAAEPLNATYEYASANPRGRGWRTARPWKLAARARGACPRRSRGRFFRPPTGRGARSQSRGECAPRPSGST